MAVFAYRGRSGASAVNGEIEADNRPAAVALLRAKGVVATQVEEKKAKAAAAAAAAAKLGGSVKAKDLAISECFCGFRRRRNPFPKIVCKVVATVVICLK